MYRHSRPAVVAAALSALFAAAPAVAADWPQWRGVNRDGTSAEVGLLKEWPAGGPKLLWRAEKLGAGFSTPSVAGGKVFVIGNEGMDAEYVRAYSAADGKLVWSSQKVGRVGNPNQQPPYPAARATPTVDGDLVFALGSDGDLACLDAATGTLKWHKSLRKDFGGKPGDWAYSESPLVEGDRVIVTPGGADATVVALDKKTGEVAWKFASPDADEAGYGSPVVADIAGVRQVVNFLGKGVVGLDPATGKQLWKFAGTSGRANMTTPVVHDGLVYTAGGLAVGGAAKVTKGADGTWTATQVYADKKLPISSGGVVRVGDYGYGGTQQGVQCFDLRTGAIKWQEKGVGPASLAVADGRLYLHGEAGPLALVEPTPDGYRERGRFTPADLPPRAPTAKAYAHPVIADGKLFVRDGDVLLCYDVKAK
ncbi:MAG TPA: PQQ-binding-like beta-propeller repeat protein [Humisphaera sp.]